MSISGSLNILAERALIACDASYFTNISPATINISRPAGDTDPTHLYLGQSLAPLVDSGPLLNGYQPVYPTAALTQGYVVDREFADVASGFKAVAFKNSATNDVILAFGGTDGTNATDWRANVGSYGFSEWDAATRNTDIMTYLGEENGVRNSFVTG